MFISMEVIVIPILKKCSWHGCTKILENGVKYCKYHQEKTDMENKKRYREYSNRRRRDEEQKKYQDFYNSKEWIRLRDIIRVSCYGIDIVEFYKTGRIVQGQTVHHIIELNEDWNSRLDICNLIYLTEQNHRRIHAKYDEADKEKKAMQRMLFALLEQFNKDYC